VRETWRNTPFTGNSESYIRHVKEGFGMGTSLSLYRLHEGTYSYTEYSKRHVKEGSENGAFL
jgi:hypothetical protein